MPAFPAVYTCLNIANFIYFLLLPSLLSPADSRKISKNGRLSLYVWTVDLFISQLASSFSGLFIAIRLVNTGENFAERAIWGHVNLLDLFSGSNNSRDVMPNDYRYLICRRMKRYPYLLSDLDWHERIEFYLFKRDAIKSRATSVKLNVPISVTSQTYACTHMCFYIDIENR